MTTTDVQGDGHRDHLTALSAEAGPLTAASPNASLNNRDWFLRTGGAVRARPARRELHTRLLEEAEARHPDVRRDRQAIVLAGPPGAGKSTALAALVEATRTQAENWRVINADDFKDDLLEEALRDGSYYRQLVPAEVAALEAAGERFWPRELASLVHQESGMLAERARDRAIERGDNVVIDGTLSHERSADLLMEQLTQAGYEIRIAAVEASRDVVEARIVSRWRAGYLAAENGTAVDERGARLGGRWVPSAFTASLYPPGRPSESVCAGIAQGVAERHTAVRQIDPCTESPDRTAHPSGSSGAAGSEPPPHCWTARPTRPWPPPRPHHPAPTPPEHPATAPTAPTPTAAQASTRDTPPPTLDHHHP